ALADSDDPLKRAKGRRGLELAAKLQRIPRLDVTIDERPVSGIGVDQMIIELARLMPAFVVTTDVALAQVSRLNGISVLNINDLANAIKTVAVPGQTITVQLMRPGEQPGQAVGFLPDGTMVVADQAASLIGATVDLVVSSSLQTSAGRLIFASLLSAVPPEAASAEPSPASDPAAEVAESPTTEEQFAAPRGPFPPPKAFRPTRPGTPRNPRR
ncbi:MAG: hypothetical protein ACOYPS_07115, partial [Phycisphaerales bacterium]